MKAAQNRRNLFIAHCSHSSGDVRGSIDVEHKLTFWATRNSHTHIATHHRTKQYSHSSKGQTLTYPFIHSFHTNLTMYRSNNNATSISSNTRSRGAFRVSFTLSSSLPLLRKLQLAWAINRSLDLIWLLRLDFSFQILLLTVFSSSPFALFYLLGSHQCLSPTWNRKSWSECSPRKERCPYRCFRSSSKPE